MQHHHLDPRARRRRELAPPVDALAAAVRLESLSADMRARQLAGGPAPADDEPPTGLLDLAAVRAAIGGAAEDVDPAAAAWIAGGPDPVAARIVEQVDQLEPFPSILDVARAVDELAPAEDVDEPLEHEPHDEPCCEVLPAEPIGPYVAGGQVPAVDVPRETPLPDDTQEHVPESAAPTSAEPVVVTPPSPPTSAPALVVPRVFISEREPRPGWSSRHDPRSLGYGIRARLGVAPLQDVDLPVGPTLDQGQEGECVGCGVVDATNVLRLLADSSARLLKIDAAAALYHRAQQLDDRPGVDYSGTSVLAGMQAGVEAGYFGSYLWAFGTRDIATALGHKRPVIVGVPWLTGMYDTGPGGLVEVKGDDNGAGHCLAVVKLRMRGPQGQPGVHFGWLNSWGRSYGDGGIGWIHHRALAELLADRGEAAIPVPTS